MADRAEAGGGFTVLDGVALVTGAAVASVHLRSAVPEFDGAGRLGLGLVPLRLALDDLGRAVRLPGPAVLHQAGRLSPAGRPALGAGGLPWLLAALVEDRRAGRRGRRRAARPGLRRLPGRSAWRWSAMVAVPVLAARYLLVDPSGPRPPSRPLDRPARPGPDGGLADPVRGRPGRDGLTTGPEGLRR